MFLMLFGIEIYSKFSHLLNASYSIISTPSSIFSVKLPNPEPKIIAILKVYIDFLITKEWNHREKYGGTDKVCIQKKKC